MCFQTVGTQGRGSQISLFVGFLVSTGLGKIIENTKWVYQVDYSSNVKSQANTFQIQRVTQKLSFFPSSKILTLSNLHQIGWNKLGWNRRNQQYLFVRRERGLEKGRNLQVIIDEIINGFLFVLCSSFVLLSSYTLFVGKWLGAGFIFLFIYFQIVITI